jgi:hypothetical protein
MPAAFSKASAPVPFWSPTFSVTEDRLTDELGLADAAADADVDADVLADDEELLDDEQPATVNPTRARTAPATSLGL